MKKSIALIMAVLMMMTTLFSNAVFAADEPTFVVSTATGKPGEQVQVTVSAVNNPGIVSFKLAIGYDETVLKLESATTGTIFSGVSVGPKVSPFSILWEDSINPDVTADGVIATLTFTILDTAEAGESAITVSYDQADVFNYDWEDVYFATTAGSVTVEEAAPAEPDFPAAVVNDEKANIRVGTPEVTAGLRFAATVTKATLGITGDYAYDKDSGDCFGMLLLPEYKLTASGFATVNELFESDNAAKSDILNVVAKKILAQGDDGTFTYTAVLTNVPEAKWNTNIKAVPYFLKNGKYYYGTADENSYYGVAKAARQGAYSDSNIAAITDPAAKAAAQTIANKLQSIVNKIENPSNDPDGEGWIDGWY